MTSSLTAIAAYIGWTLALASIIILFRSYMVMTHQKQANGWTRGGDVQDPAMIKRLTDAFQNCLETGPLFFAVILVAQASGQGEVTDGAAFLYIFARIVQSVSHIISASHFMVFFVRFPAFLLQIGLLVWWLAQLVS